MWQGGGYVPVSEGMWEGELQCGSVWGYLVKN